MKPQNVCGLKKKKIDALETLHQHRHQMAAMASLVSRRVQEKKEKGGAKTGLYPVLPSTPPPYQKGGVSIQTPLMKVKGGLLDMEPAQGAITLEENAVLRRQLEEKSRTVQSLSKLLLECVVEETKKEEVRQREVQAPLQTLDDCNKARKKQQADGGSVKVGSVEQMFNKRSQRNGYDAEEEEEVSVNSLRSSDSEGEEVGLEDRNPKRAKNPQHFWPVHRESGWITQMRWKPIRTFQDATLRHGSATSTITYNVMWMKKSKQVRKKQI
ncbi:hypothetical protein Q8A73_000232 [Channa argus]|nr:hypothetical protein Q8A73_000232 [Channa argus]